MVWFIWSVIGICEQVWKQPGWIQKIALATLWLGRALMLNGFLWGACSLFAIDSGA